ncbi:MAG TPA: TetR family transcriptional regulator [Solirubrobacteraceae bacterium]|jgi:AcrR family transcriptional regulator|nr:TetR family transcriptional regulator [Solirubrobacteraceae bacterium]
MRELLLDGACVQLLECPWKSVSMFEVAAQAGVHRSSLYGHFGTRQKLVAALVAREADRLPEQWSELLREHAPAPARAMQALFAHFLAASVENGLVAALLRRGETELRALAVRHKHATLGRLSGALAEAWPGLWRSDCEQIAEWLFRLALSVSRMPAGPATAHHVGELLGTYVEDRVAAGAALDPGSSSLLQRSTATTAPLTARSRAAGVEGPWARTDAPFRPRSLGAAASAPARRSATAGLTTAPARP